MAALPHIPPGLVDQFVKGPMTGEAVNAASMAFKKALIERAESTGEGYAFKMRIQRFSDSATRIVVAKAEALAADEMWVSSSTKEVLAVTQIDGEPAQLDRQCGQHVHRRELDVQLERLRKTLEERGITIELGFAHLDRHSLQTRLIYVLDDVRQRFAPTLGPYSRRSIVPAALPKR